MRSLIRCLAAGALSLSLSAATPAHAVHLFPLTPIADPLGHDCAKDLTAPAVQSPAATVQVVGFSFLDEASLSSVSAVKKGQTVRFEWTADHCHSVTFVTGGIQGTYGAPGFMPAQPELVRIGSGNSFSVTFANAGTYSYLCIHHSSVGMTGTVNVT